MASPLFSWLYYGYSTNPFDGIFHFSYNLVPTLYKVITGKYLLGNWVKTMLIGNILMFLPLGFLLPLYSKKINTRNIFLYALLIPLIIEIIQLIIGRSCDIDDVLMNFLGIIIGYFIIKIISKIAKKQI